MRPYGWGVHLDPSSFKVGLISVSRSIMAQLEHFELRVNLLIEETKQLIAQNFDLRHALNLVTIKVDGVAERLGIVSEVLEAGLTRPSYTFGEDIVQQVQDKRDLDRLIDKVQSLMMWLPWPNRVCKWWCKQRL
jgi:NAD-dependent DNA ligase